MSVKTDNHAGDFLLSPSGTSGYRVLARTYRPQDFNSLVGQEAMVQTVRNAFATGRIPHAWILCGVRGVGKTTSARILARALNYKTPQIDSPSVDFSIEGEHCRAIIEGHHVDVMEMDAASHTGINDVREIIDSVRYAPACARFKVYIIDEVHMLSTQAFNGLLKTLEEPPSHVKFILATTEIRKVPMTILSRCQRFDLRRIEEPVIVRALARIGELEKIETEDTALSLIAHAAGGSMRDAQSLLDQAIVYGAGSVTADRVREMLGLSNRSCIADLFEALMKGNIAKALEEFRHRCDLGTEPVRIFIDLAEFTHFVTRIGCVGEIAKNAFLSENEDLRARNYAELLSIPLLSRTWQMLLKAITEIQEAPDPSIAGEMALIRLAHAADLPTLDKALKTLEDIILSGDSAISSPSESAIGKGSPSLTQKNLEADSFEQESNCLSMDEENKTSEKHALHSLHDIAILADMHRDIHFKINLKKYVRPVHIGPGRLEISLTENAPRSLVNDLSSRLKKWTTHPYEVLLSSEKGGKTLAEEEEGTDKERMTEAHNDPVVREVLAHFSGAHITHIHTRSEDH